MEKLWFNGFHLGKGRNNDTPLDRDKAAIHIMFKSDYNGESFYWYPTYEQTKQLIHFLTALHGDKEINTRVFNNNSLIEIYKEQIEKFLEEENEISNCQE